MVDFAIYPNAALTQRAEHRALDANLLQAGQALLEAAQSVQAYGLAAAHIGLVEPLVVVSFAGDASPRDYRILYNAEITGYAEESAFGPEGSVSLPGIEVPVERPVWVDLVYTDTAGERVKARLEGFAARVAAHEIDQMNGVFFLSRLSRIKRDTALRKFDKSRRQQG